MDRHEVRGLRRRVRTLMRELEVPAPLDVTDLCARIGRARGREIVLTASDDMPVTEAFALWLETADVDHIVYQRHTSPLHRRHLVLHELGHIVAGHGSDDRLEADVVGSVMPDLPAAVVELALRRHSYDPLQEREAEYVASTILEWAALVEVLPVRPVDPPTARIDHALGDRRGWL